MEPSLDQVRSLAEEGDFARIPVKRELFADAITPIEALRALRATSNHCFILESAEAEERWGRYTFLGFKPTLEFTCKQGKAKVRRAVETDHETTECFDVDHPSQAIRTLLAQHKSPHLDGFPPFSGGLVGYFSFDYLAYSEPTLRKGAPTDGDFLDVDLMLFDTIITFDSYRQKIILVTGVDVRGVKGAGSSVDVRGVKGAGSSVDVRSVKDGNVAQDEGANSSAANDPDVEGAVPTLEAAYRKAEETLDFVEGVLRHGARKEFEPLELAHDLTPRFSQEQYAQMIAETKHRIHEGEIFQVVLSNPLTAPAQGSLFDTYRVLRCENPSPYMLYFTSDDVEIAGASPETLTRLEDNRLFTFPLAGTRPRAATPEEDAAVEAGLLKDEKELAEHNMLVDLGRNDLGRVCKLGTVQVSRYLDVLKFSRVMHIGSTVEGQLDPTKDALDAVDAVLPAGTLSGAPKLRAVEIIHELEQTERGIYGGALGYLDFAGNMDICIAIRLAYKKNGVVCVQSGAGIVADSNPDSEYHECINKARAVVEALHAAEGGLR